MKRREGVTAGCLRGLGGGSRDSRHRGLPEKPALDERAERPAGEGPGVAMHICNPGTRRLSRSSRTP